MTEDLLSFHSYLLLPHIKMSEILKANHRKVYGNVSNSSSSSSISMSPSGSATNKEVQEVLVTTGQSFLMI